MMQPRFLLGAAVLTLAGKAACANFLNHTQLLAGLEDPAWFEANVPIVEMPSQQIQQIYYYRWQTYREHLVYSGAQYGYLASEFLQPVSYGAPYGGIVAAAGHHINEGKWIRDVKYGQDLVNYWLSGPGQFAKPQDEGTNPTTADWAHEYSFWAASSVWQQYLVTGDKDFVTGQLDNLVSQYDAWQVQYNDQLGLYWQVPVWDATEYTVASYETDPGNPYHGGAGYRPTINAYQYGDAMAIAAIAKLKGDDATANDFTNRAGKLKTAMKSHLWDSSRNFYMHKARDGDQQLLTTREIMGFIPWMFNMPDASDSVAFTALNDSQGFAAKFGPTTAERRSSKYMYEASQGCCRWDGPSWPYATAQTLTAVENLLHNYPAQSYYSAGDYVRLLQGYAATQYRDGAPHVAEAHDPDADRWMYDNDGSDFDYNHSTYVDNVLAGLLGLRGQSDDTLVVNPLAPSSWDYFAVENAAYHGHTVAVLWDKTGSRYGQGTGLRVYVDGAPAGNRATLGSLTVKVGSSSVKPASSLVNIAANSQNAASGTLANASYTSPYDAASRVIDGQIWRTNIYNSRWTSYQSPNAQDSIALDLRRSQAITEVHLYFYADNDGVRIPSSYDLQYLAPGNGQWTSIPNQTRTPKLPASSNVRSIITFPSITTSRLRVVAPNPGGGKGWGLNEFQVWTPAVFVIQNVNSGKLMGVENASTQNSANVWQYDDNGTRDHLWQFVPTPQGWYKIRNINSGLLLAVQYASTQNSAPLQQYEDNGTDDHLWRLIAKGDGQFLIRNKNSGLYAGVDREGTNAGAYVVQFEDNGTKDHLWILQPSVPST